MPVVHVVEGAPQPSKAIENGVSLVGSCSELQAYEEADDANDACHDYYLLLWVLGQQSQMKWTMGPEDRGPKPLVLQGSPGISEVPPTSRLLV
jgi:hypothetical protein